ncbi:MAG: rod shape-determining protein MreC [Candidatus Aminicenantes bacterium]|nr:rod shape-determining protein MreC [Candidatus Aminicenantes bacterium]
MPLSLNVKKTPWLLVGLLAGQLVLISFQVPVGSKTSLFERALFGALAPIQRGLSEVTGGVRGLWTNYAWLRHVQDQNQSLHRELFALREENAFLRNWLRELKSDRDIREAAARWAEDLETASVIGMDASNVFRSVVLNRGSAHGVAKNMPVLDGAGCLVGRIVDPVARHEARLQLITDSECGVSVQAGSPPAVGILRGSGTGDCELKYILGSGPELQPGMEILTSGLDGIYPAGVRAGTISAVQRDAALFQKIQVKPHFDLAGLGRVAVLKRLPRGFLSEESR